MTSARPSPPTPHRQQAEAERTLRDLGATVSVSFAAGVPHDHPEYVPGCFRCELSASAERVNSGQS